MKNPLRSIADFFGVAVRTAARYPLTISLLAAATAVCWVQIVVESGDLIYAKALSALLLGAAFGMAAQSLAEWLELRRSIRWLGMAAALLIAAVFFALSLPVSVYPPQVTVRAACLVISAIILFAWIPVFWSPLSFHRVFAAHLKALLTAVLYSAVLSIGLSVIIFSVNALLIPVDSKAYFLCLSIVWVFFAPLSYLSFLPKKPLEDHDTPPEREFVYLRHSKVAEVLISYILLPLLSVFTAILILYAIKTAALGEWTSSVLESLFLICAGAGIALFLIARSMQGRFERIFCLVFPKALLFLSVFQLTSLFLTFPSQGLDEGRYFIILLSLFALVISLLFSFFPAGKNSLIAPIAILFILVAVIPPADAFSLSRDYQIGVLESTLAKNNMLSGDRVKANPDISLEDKRTIVSSAGYLIDRGYTQFASFLPSGFDSYEDIEPLFGFSAYNYGAGPEPVRYINFFARKNVVLNIRGYDVQLSAMVFDGAAAASTDFTIGGTPYRMWLEETGESGILHIRRTDTGAAVTLDLYGAMLAYAETSQNPESTEPVSLEASGDAGRMRAVVYQFYASVENGAFRNVNMNVQVYFSAS